MPSSAQCFATSLLRPSPGASRLPGFGTSLRQKEDHAKEKAGREAEPRKETKAVWESPLRELDSVGKGVSLMSSVTEADHKNQVIGKVNTGPQSLASFSTSSFDRVAHCQPGSLQRNQGLTRRTPEVPRSFSTTSLVSGVTDASSPGEPLQSTSVEASKAPQKGPSESNLLRAGTVQKLLAPKFGRKRNPLLGTADLTSPVTATSLQEQRENVPRHLEGADVNQKRPAESQEANLPNPAFGKLSSSLHQGRQPGTDSGDFRQSFQTDFVGEINEMAAALGSHSKPVLGREQVGPSVSMRINEGTSSGQGLVGQAVFRDQGSALGAVEERGEAQKPAVNAESSSIFSFL